MSFQFSQDQLDAVNGICDTLLDSNIGSHALAVLTGPAGTGKTTVVTEVLNQIYNKSPLSKVSLCATTNRAATVLSDITGKRVLTVHAMFKLRPSITKYGNEILKSTGVCSIPNGTILVIDEASMLSNSFLTAVVDIIKKKALKILFVGDPFQLPPISDICSIFDGSLTTFTLSTSHRQSIGNPILDKANEFREYIEGIRKTAPDIITSINTKGEGIHVLPHTNFVTQFVQKYVNYDAGDEVDIPLCTYTNESAINYNNMIRKAAYFLEDTIQPFYVGERLVSNSSVLQGMTTVLTSNEVVRVISYIEAKIEDMIGYKVTVMGDYSTATKTKIKTVFVPKNKGIKDKALKVLKDIAVTNKSRNGWTDFYRVKQLIADLRPPFAGTTHKAQGGTFPAIFIDLTNINKCRDAHIRARLMYVALTRATTNVYINS